MASKKNEVETLDATVDKYGLNIEICPNLSRHVDRGMNIPGDMMFEHDTMFLVKRVAYLKMGISQSDIRAWSPEDCKKFYLEMDLNLHPFEEFVEGEKSVSWYFRGRSEYYIRFLSFRWSHKMAFTSYSERVNIALEAMIGSTADEANEIINKIRDLEEQKSALNGELMKLASSDGISDRLKNILQNVDISLTDLE